MASQQQKKVGIAFSFNLSTEEVEPIKPPQTFEKLRVGQHLKLLGVQPGYRPYHHRTHLLLPSHTKVGSFRLTSILFRIDSRVLTSLYEALNVQAQMTCEAKEMDYLPLWFLYSIVVMNILLVINASSNFLIYLFAGNSFRDQVNY